MKKAVTSILLLALCTTTVLGASTAKSKFAINDLDLSIGLNYGDLQSSLDKASVFKTDVALKGSLSLTGNIKFHFNTGLSFQNGSSSSRFEQRTYSAKSKLINSYSYVSFKPFSLLEGNIGALDNTKDEYTSPFLNLNVTSMGIREKFSLNIGKLDITITGTQIKPSNEEVSDRITTIEEGSPKYYQEMVFSKYESKNFLLAAELGHFAYQDLASDVAFNDQYHGNEVINGSDSSLSEYAYPFKGWFYGGELALKLDGSLKIGTRAAFIKNDEADKSTNSGEIFTGYLEAKFMNHEVKAYFGIFENGANTAPAYYTSLLAKPNYEGSYGGFSIKNTEDLTTEIKFIKREVINASEILADENLVIIKLRKEYDIF